MPSSTTPSSSIGGTTSNLVTFDLKKYVTLTCDLEPERDAVIENSEGMRFKMRYKPGGSVVLESPFSLRPPGAINSGGDWVFARKDGVIFVDSRVTLGFKFRPTGWTQGNPDPAALVDATLKGTIDLCRTLGIPRGEDAYAAFVGGTGQPVQTVGPNPAEFCHHITGALRFEVGDGNGGSGAKDWGYANIKATAANFDNLKLLVRQQFLAIGTITISNTRRLDAKQIVVEAWGL